MRLIDADAVAEAIRDALSDETAGAYFTLGLSVGLAYVTTADTIDAVPVVRCKDCVNFERDDAEGIEDWCAINGARTEEDGYCAWGERKAEP